MADTSIPLTITGIPDNLCFEGTFAEAIKAVLEKVYVLIPNTITNVVVSSTTPSDAQRSYVWFRLSNGGDFLGIYIFASGDWRQISPVPNALSWVYGDSDSPPAGYVVANSTDSPLTVAEKAHLEAMWYPVGPGPWTLFQVIYVGF